MYAELHAAHHVRALLDWQQTARQVIQQRIVLFGPLHLLPSGYTVRKLLLGIPYVRGQLVFTVPMTKNGNWKGCFDRVSPASIEDQLHDSLHTRFYRTVYWREPRKVLLVPETKSLEVIKQTHMFSLALSAAARFKFRNSSVLILASAVSRANAQLLRALCAHATRRR